MTVARHGAHRRQGARSTSSATGCSADHAADVQAGAQPAAACRSAATGATAPMWWRRCAVRSTSAAQRMPGRAIGVQWFSVDRKAQDARARHDAAAADAAEHDAARAGQDRRARAGEEARVVVAAVDVGILNLTNYKPPAPDDYFSASAGSTAEIRDLYGQLIDGMQGTRGADPHRRRRRRRRLQGSAADPAAARALFRHRHGRPRRHRRGRVRHSGLRRHGAGDGGRLVEGQGRPAPSAT